MAYFEALKLLQTSKVSFSKDFIEIFIEEMINLHIGQGTELYFRDNGDRIPTIEEYFKICAKKTGGLFRLFTRLLLKSTRNYFDSELKLLIIGLAEELGKFYQIRDDYLNLFKGDASDLIEGKFTLPTIFADIKTIKCRSKTEIKEIMKELDEIGAEKFCLRTLKEMAEDMENTILEIEKRTEHKNDLKEIIYSLLELEK